MRILIATQSDIVSIDTERGETMPTRGVDGHPTCLAADPLTPGRAWCGTGRGGAFVSDDAGLTWRPVGLSDRHITAIVASPAQAGLVWVGTEPSEVWRSANAGETWEQARGLEALPSSSEWSFPPKPDTHHVRWIACHPTDAGRLWFAIEAGALISTDDGGVTWRDRVPDGPYDTHELAIHRDLPAVLRVSAGDGYFESHDSGRTWSSPGEGLEVDYFRSVAVDPGRADVVIASAASGPYTAYVAGKADGRLYRRVGSSRWERVVHGWPDDPSTIAPLLTSGGREGELWAADERGLHVSDDAGLHWRRVARYATPPRNLRGLAMVR